MRIHGPLQMAPDLPLDLAWDIADKVTDKCTLLSLTRVSLPWKPVAQRFLYRRLVVDGGANETWDRDFIRFLTDHPRIARYIQLLHITARKHNDFPHLNMQILQRTLACVPYLQELQISMCFWNHTTWKGVTPHSALSRLRAQIIMQDSDGPGNPIELLLFSRQWSSVDFSLLQDSGPADTVELPPTTVPRLVLSHPFRCTGTSSVLRHTENLIGIEELVIRYVTCEDSVFLNALFQHNTATLTSLRIKLDYHKGTSALYSEDATLRCRSPSRIAMEPGRTSDVHSVAPRRVRARSRERARLARLAAARDRPRAAGYLSRTRG